MNNRIKKTKSFISSVLFLVLTIFLVFILIYGIRYICYKKEDANMPIYKVNTNDKKLALTFDVAWGADNIDEILNVLKKHNIKSTFFLVGSWVDENEELVKKIHNEGHEIGNHSDTHANLKELSIEAISNEITSTSNKISKITGQKTTLFRPPFGDLDKEAIDICKSLNHQIIKWDIDSGDWKELGPNHVIDKVVKNSQPGSIILFHANISNIEQYIDSIIYNLKKDGYDILTISDMIYKENFRIDSNGVQSKK